MASPSASPSPSTNSTIGSYPFWEESTPLYLRTYFWTLPVFLVAIIFLALTIIWCVKDVKRYNAEHDRRQAKKAKNYHNE